MTEQTIYELSSPGRIGFRFPPPDVPKTDLPRDFIRKDLPFPELAEIDIIRHFTNLSKLNYCIDSGLNRRRFPGVLSGFNILFGCFQCHPKDCL